MSSKNKKNLTRGKGKKKVSKESSPITELDIDPGLYGFSPFTMLKLHDITQNNSLMDIPMYQRGLKFSGKPFSSSGRFETTGKGSGIFGVGSPFFSGQSYLNPNLTVADANMLIKTSYNGAPTPENDETISSMEQGMKDRKENKKLIDDAKLEKVTGLPFRNYFTGGKVMSFEDYYKEYINKTTAVGEIPKNFKPADEVAIKYGPGEKVDQYLNINQEFFKERKDHADYSYDIDDEVDKDDYANAMKTFGKKSDELISGGKKKRTTKKTPKRTTATKKKTTATKKKTTPKKKRTTKK
jgi:hypothetical protein